MTFEIEIPTDIQPFGWELNALNILDELVGFDPVAVEIRSAWIEALLEEA